jgi:DHA1 family bicyclomycin/chloramphenicol resistance-like MFS transporter
MHAPAPPALAGRTRPEPPFVEFVLLVAVMMAITAFAVDGFLPALPAIGRDFGVPDDNDLQLVVYVYMFGFGLAQLVFGPLSDVWGRRPLYLAGLGVFAAGGVGALLAPDLTTLLVARFVQGIGAASGRVLAVAIVRDRFAGREMARVMSLTTMVFMTVPALAPAIGALLLLFGTWRLIFGAVLLTGLAYGLWFWVRMPETLAPANRLPLSAGRLGGALRATVTSRPTLGYASGVGLLFGCVMGLVGSSQQLFAEAYGLGAWFPLAFGLQALAMAAAALTNSTIVRRFGMRRISHTSLLTVVGCGIAQVLGALAFAGLPPLWLFGAPGQDRRDRVVAHRLLHDLPRLARRARDRPGL